MLLSDEMKLPGWVLEVFHLLEWLSSYGHWFRGFRLHLHQFGLSRMDLQSCLLGYVCHSVSFLLHVGMGVSQESNIVSEVAVFQAVKQTPDKALGLVCCGCPHNEVNDNEEEKSQVHNNINSGHDVPVVVEIK